MITEVLTGTVALLSGSFVTHLFLNKKYKADAQATVASEALKLVQSLQTELETVKKEIQALREDNVKMHIKVATLETERVLLQGRIDHLESELSKYKK